jgi:two-component system, NtrC family, nitrogen regulation sensor histidine kinase NtrY
LKLSEIKIHKQLPRRSLLIFAAALFILSFISAYYFKVQPIVSNQQKLIQGYIQKQLEDGKQLLSDSALMRKLVLKSESLEEFKKIADKEYGVFLFAETISDNQDLLFWNNQKILPPNADFDLHDGQYFQHLANGYYVVYKTTLQFTGMSNNIVAYVLIPVLNEYYLQTDYLLTQFVHDKDAIKQIALSPTVTEYPVRSIDNNILFYIKGVSYTNVVTKDTVTILLRIAAMIFLLFFIHVVAESLTRKKSMLLRNRLPEKKGLYTE